MSAYFVATIKVHDENEYRKYVENVDSVFKKFNGQYLVVADNPEVLEGKWEGTRFILIEFPDKESLKKWYYSPEYQEILKYRLAGADSDAIIVNKKHEKD